MGKINSCLKKVRIMVILHVGSRDLCGRGMREISNSCNVLYFEWSFHYKGVWICHTNIHIRFVHFICVNFK